MLSFFRSSARWLVRSFRPPVCEEEGEEEDGGDLHNVEGCPWFGDGRSDVASPPSQDSDDGTDGVRRCQDLHGVDGLHQARRGEQKRRVRNATGGGDNLAAAPVDGFIGDGSVQNLELDVADGLVAERPFSCTPLEPDVVGVHFCSKFW